MEELLNWIFLSGTDVAVTQTEDGEITADRPETVEKFRAIFEETGLRSFFGVVLRDDEGKLGALGFEYREAFDFDEDTRDLLAILVNQATVAVRNAQLYRQVPLAGFLKPLDERRRKLLNIPVRRRQAWAIARWWRFWCWSSPRSRCASRAPRACFRRAVLRSARESTASSRRFCAGRATASRPGTSSRR
jgi:hypothetical protein